ncbi:hypothetical protein GCM10009856_54630 [Mycolicibacterium llatzerense]
MALIEQQRHARNTVVFTEVKQMGRDCKTRVIWCGPWGAWGAGRMLGLSEVATGPDRSFARAIWVAETLWGR